MLTLVQTGASCKWVNDSQRFLLENFDVIEDSPSQIYHYALPFCPSSSWLHECYAAEFSQEVKVVKGLRAEWGACSRTVLFDSIVRTLAYWKDLIAVGLESGNIIILDAITGVHISILSGHTHQVKSVVFSLDGTFLVSGSGDGAVNLWDMQTGGVVKLFLGHTKLVISVSISLDQATIASGSGDGTVRLWNIQTGECYHVIEQQDYVPCVCFSPKEPQYLISVSGDKVWQWGTNGHQVGPIYDGSYAAFSSNGTQFVSCKGAVATVHHSNSGKIVAEFHVVKGRLYPCCFSYDGRHIAAAADEIIYIWDITSSDPHPIETFVGHTEYITSLTFPSFLISASADQSVKLWQVGTSSTVPAVTDAVLTLPDSNSIYSVTLRVGDGIAISCDLAGVVKTWDISTGLCKASSQTPAKGHILKDAQLIGSRLILAWHKNENIHIWDAEKDKLQMVDTSGLKIHGIRLSGDGSKVFVLNKNFIQAWSAGTGEAVGQVEWKGRGYLWPDCLYSDGSRIWVCFQDSGLQGWDFGISGSPPILLSNTSSDRPHLNFVREMNGPSRVEDTVTGKEIFQLRGRYEDPFRVCWDGQYLVAGYWAGELLILNFNHVLLQ